MNKDIQRRWRVSVVQHASDRWTAAIEVEAATEEQAREEALRLAEEHDDWHDVDGHTEYEFDAYDVEEIEDGDGIVTDGDGDSDFADRLLAEMVGLMPGARRATAEGDETGGWLYLKFLANDPDGIAIYRAMLARCGGRVARYVADSVPAAGGWKARLSLCFVDRETLLEASREVGDRARWIMEKERAGIGGAADGGRRRGRTTRR